METNAFQTPSVEIVRQYLQKWEDNVTYVIPEKVLETLFTDCPRNADISGVLLKVIALNTIYSTNIRSSSGIYRMAEHITDSGIDDRIKKADMSLVDDIARGHGISGKHKEYRFYSFATKYCSFSNPEQYPIYDYSVDRGFRYFRKKDKFANFKNEDLKDYLIFKSTMQKFREYYGLEQFSFKEIDKYLWQVFKPYNPL